MSVELSKAIMMAAISVQTAHPSALALAPLEDAQPISSSEYRKCRKRIRALESAVCELRDMLCKYTEMESRPGVISSELQEAGGNPVAGTV
jgi:hypothetical protein